jgi:hypothetical protein
MSVPYDHTLSGGCLTSCRVVWDPGIIFSFSLVQLMERQVVMALLEDKKSLGREDFSCPHFWVPLFCNGNDLCGLSVKEKGVKRGHLMSLS